MNQKLTQDYINILMRDPEEAFNFVPSNTYRAYEAGFTQGFKKAFKLLDTYDEFIWSTPQEQNENSS